jgi:hypothetical protein
LPAAADAVGFTTTDEWDELSAAADAAPSGLSRVCMALHSVAVMNILVIDEGSRGVINGVVM